MGVLLDAIRGSMPRDLWCPACGSTAISDEPGRVPLGRVDVALLTCETCSCLLTFNFSHLQKRLEGRVN